MSASERNLRLIVEYDGTDFSGWQVQKRKRTVQGELVRAIREITGEKIVLNGSGRTDAGVHAEAQVANFHTHSRLPAARWPHALNAHLPDDIAVLSAEDVPIEFHAQFHARSKQYRYVVLNRPIRSALYRGASHLVRASLNVDMMRQAAVHLVGPHDFRSFTTEASRKENTSRTITRLDVVAQPPFITFIVESDGFLYNMVRSIVGTLLEVGNGAHAPDWVREVLEAKDRRRAGPTAPARGLCLVSVRYE